MARADVETAGQPPQAYLLIDVGVGGIKTADGPSREPASARWVRILAARAALRVLEAQYDAAVRTRVNSLHTAFVDVREARDPVNYAKGDSPGYAGPGPDDGDSFQGGTGHSRRVERIKTKRDACASTCRRTRPTSARPRSSWRTSSTSPTPRPRS